MNRYLPSQSALLVLLEKCIRKIPLTWDMSDLQVVSLHDIYPLLDSCIDACLVGKMFERSVVYLDYH